MQERLLPIGTTINLVQKMNKTFGLGDIDSASQSSSLNREDSSEKEQVYCIHIIYFSILQLNLHKINLISHHNFILNLNRFYYSQ